MPTYLWSVKNAKGLDRALNIAAASAQEARARLGKMAEARQDFRECHPLLKAANVHPLLKTCEASV